LKKVSIITVNFNQPQVTKELLRSLASHTDYPHIEIIVIDNGSDFDHIRELSAEFPGPVYIRSQKNLGFAGGNNLGIKKASGDYLFFVNNDTEFTKGLVEKLLTVMDNNPAVGIISPKIMYHAQPQILQYAGFTKINFFTCRNKCIGQFEPDKGQYDLPAHPTSYAHGAAMMVRRDAIEKAGLMPEPYFLYYEEMDWCEKIKKAGYEIWVEPAAVIYHKESLSVGTNSPLKEYYMVRNRILFVRRNASAWQRTVFYFYFLLVLTPKHIFKHLLHRRFDLLKSFFKAILWNVSTREILKSDY
jgi:hypothetical protein